MLLRHSYPQKSPGLFHLSSHFLAREAVRIKRMDDGCDITENSQSYTIIIGLVGSLVVRQFASSSVRSFRFEVNCAAA